MSVNGIIGNDGLGEFGYEQFPKINILLISGPNLKTCTIN